MYIIIIKVVSRQYYEFEYHLKRSKTYIFDEIRFKILITISSKQSLT